jgi:hypothetical protein
MRLMNWEKCPNHFSRVLVNVKLKYLDLRLVSPCSIRRQIVLIMVFVKLYTKQQGLNRIPRLQ